MKTKIKILPPPAGYALAAAGYDKKESYLNSFEKGRLLPLLGDLKGKKALDVGAGTGRLTLALAELGAEVIALDSASEMLEILKKKNKKIKTIVADAESMPFSDNFFDFVIAAFLIVHLKDPRTFFDQAYRVLKDGGRLVVTNINQKEPPEIKTIDGKIIKIESYYHRPEAVRRALRELAFEIEREEIVEERGGWVNQIVAARK